MTPSDRPPARILLVEDDPDTLELFSTALGRRGHQVTTAASAEEASTLLRAQRFDLLVTDWDLPGKSGAVLAAEEAAAGTIAKTSVVVVTAHPEPSGVEDLPVVPKPVELTPFLEQIDRLLQARPMEPAPEPRGTPTVVELVLYATAGTPASSRAQRNLESVLARFDPGTWRLSVCDPATDPLRAERDRVVFAPTLVRHGDQPGWFLGDLSNTAALHDMLLLSGAAER